MVISPTPVSNAVSAAASKASGTVSGYATALASGVVSGYNFTSGNSTSGNSTVNRNSSVSIDDFNGDIFVPVGTDAPLSLFSQDQVPVDIPEGVSNDRPYETNKFYVNLFLSNQTDPIWSYPYGLFYDKSALYGWSVSYSADEEVLGHDVGISTEGADYLTSAVGVASMSFSATTFDSSVVLGLSEMKDMSVNVKLSQTVNDTTDYVEFPTVLGQGFVTAIYHGDLIPVLKATAGIETFSQETSSALQDGTTKYKATLFSGESWLVYVTSNSTAANFTVNTSTNDIEASQAIDGLIIQVAVAPNGTDSYYDMAAGLYQTKAVVEGTVEGDSASYGFTYSTAGKSSSGAGLVFALPHHVQSLSSETALTATGLALDFTTKGTMYGFLTNQLVMSETLNTDVQFAPWSAQSNSSVVSWTTDQLTLLASAVQTDLEANMKDTVSGIDTYTAGKLLDKFAYILYVLSDVLEDEDAATTTLANLKEAYNVFLTNSQEYPLVYDTRFGGITSSAGLGGDTGSDYGATYYNDHHFHYGYYVHSAAIIAYVDSKYGNGTWVDENKDWVNNLIRDVANPSEEDAYFPVSRMYDWFNGHSWAAGLFTSGAGRNEESTSEDYNFAYGMKLWGKMVGDAAMEARGDLMIAVSSRAINNYMLYSDDNAVEPSEITVNKVSGIFYENKIAYTTFFGNKAEYIHGIHMLPITPVSPVVRGPTYVEQEWNDYISSIVDDAGSWTGVLRLNQALYDPKGSYEFFSQDDFDIKWLDDGQSRSWCLAYSAALANAT